MSAKITLPGGAELGRSVVDHRECSVLVRISPAGRKGSRWPSDSGSRGARKSRRSWPIQCRNACRALVRPAGGHARRRSPRCRRLRTAASNQDCRAGRIVCAPILIGADYVRRIWSSRARATIVGPWDSRHACRLSIGNCDLSMSAVHGRQGVSRADHSGQVPSGLPLHSWPNGSMIRPRRHPCSSPHGRGLCPGPRPPRPGP